MSVSASQRASRRPSGASVTSLTSSRGGGGEDLVEISHISNSLLRRLAVLRPAQYVLTPASRPDMVDYIEKKTARSRAMVSSQDRMLYQLQTIHSGLDALDLEVARLDEELRRRRIKRRGYVPRDGAAYVMREPDTYSLWDFQLQEKVKEQTSGLRKSNRPV